MSIATDIAASTVSKAAMPWLIVVAVMVLTATGASGMYFGTLIERGRHANEIAALKDEQLRSINYATELWKQSQSRGDEIANKFEGLLKNIKIENKTFVNEVQKEVQREVYTDCKLPDSGVDLLRRQVNSANMRFVGPAHPAAAHKGKP